MVKKLDLFAAALYAVSPIIIAYSRSSWNPNPLPFISLLLLYLLYKAVKTRSWKLFILVGILFGIAMQLQYIVVFLGVIIAVFTVFGYIQINKRFDFLPITKNAFQLLCGFIIGWSPFLAFEIYHKFPNIKTIINFILHPVADQIPVETMTAWERIIDVFFRLFARLIGNFPPPEQLPFYAPATVLFWQIGILVLAGASVYFLFKIKNKLVMLLFSLWFFLGILLFGFYKDSIFDYYFGFLFPLPFILLGNVFQHLWDAKEKFTSKRIIAVIVFIGLFLFNLNSNPFRYAPNKQKEQVQKISEFVLSKTDGKPFNFALMTKGNSDHGYRYFFKIKGRDPVLLIPSIQDPERKSVTDQLLIVCEDPECKPLGASLHEVASFGQGEIEGFWQLQSVKVYKLRHVKN